VLLCGDKAYSMESLLLSSYKRRTCSLIKDTTSRKRARSTKATLQGLRPYGY
jgi:hypothetical protein